MGNIYFKMGEHPKALKLYRMALDQTPTAEKDLRQVLINHAFNHAVAINQTLSRKNKCKMKVMHNIGLLLVRMGKFRDAVTNFQHIMHEQGLHLVLCSVALNDPEAGKAAFHSMLDVEPPTYHQDLPIDDENDAYECVLRDVLRGDRLSRWSRRAAAHAERCLALAVAALAPLAGHNTRDEDITSASWCAEALRGYSGGSAGARLELGAALAALRTAVGPGGGSALAAGARALQRLKAVARAYHDDRVLRAEAAADAAFLGKWSEAKSLSETAARDDPYSCTARVSSALADLAAARGTNNVENLPDIAADVARRLVAASHLDPADLIAMHDLALCMELSGEAAGAEARWQRVRAAAGAGATLRALAAAGLARLAHPAHPAHSADPTDPADPAAADHWYSMIGSWDAGVTCALAELHNEIGDAQTAKHHYQDDPLQKREKICLRRHFRIFGQRRNHAGNYEEDDTAEQSVRDAEEEHEVQRDVRTQRALEVETENVRKKNNTNEESEPKKKKSQDVPTEILNILKTKKNTATKDYDDDEKYLLSFSGKSIQKLLFRFKTHRKAVWRPRTVGDDDLDKRTTAGAG
ncbi:unnamed protein product [Parnassius apollo]|uniref:(apollo) hypothetical protein n=1 Tax=Parnassius apollo TaxID=110799 RepID=A0A8S3X802_PARAO|nr:unnamed protein product [Parnassius apollo]